MSVHYCAECGKQLSEKARFCPGCGHPVEDTGDIPSEQIIETDHENVVFEEESASPVEDVLTEPETDPVRDNGIHSTDNAAHDTTSTPSQKVVADDLDTSSKIRRIVMNPILTLCAAAVALAMLIGVIILFVHTVSAPDLVGQYELIGMKQLGEKEYTESDIETFKQLGAEIPSLVITSKNSARLTLNGNINILTIDTKSKYFSMNGEEFYYTFKDNVVTLYVDEYTLVFKKLE